MREKIRFEPDCVVLALNPEEYWFVINSVFHPLAIEYVDRFEEVFLTSKETAESLFEALRDAEKAAKTTGSYWAVPRIAKVDALARHDLGFPDIDRPVGDEDGRSRPLVRFSKEGAVLSLSPQHYRLVRAMMAHALSHVQDFDFGPMLASTRFYAERLVSYVEAAEAEAARRGFVFG